MQRGEVARSGLALHLLSSGLYATVGQLLITFVVKWDRDVKHLGPERSRVGAGLRLIRHRSASDDP